VQNSSGFHSERVPDSTGEHCGSIIGVVLIYFHIYQKGSHLKLKDLATDNHPPSTQWDNVKVFGDISFPHTISSPASEKPVGSFLGTIINGRVDHGIGHIIVPRYGRPRRLFQTLLTVVNAKTTRNLIEVVPELVVYLGSLHQSRHRQRRRNCTVYGLASDGFSFLFLTITHDGVLKESKHFELTSGDLQLVLGCLKHILEVTSKEVPEDGSELMEDACDCEMDINDSDYIRPLD
jgi:hypothetical protein